MAKIVKAIQTHLEAQSSITTLVSTRIYPLHLPRNSTYPAITHNVISNRHYHYLGGVANLATVRIQIDCWGESMSSVEAVSEAVKTALDAYIGNMGDVAIAFVRFDSERNMSEAPKDESEQWLYRVSQDYFVKHAI